MAKAIWSGAARSTPLHHYTGVKLCRNLVGREGCGCSDFSETDLCVE